VEKGAGEVLRDEIRSLIDRNSLAQVLDSLSGAVFDMADDCVKAGEQKTIEGIGKIISKQSSKAQKADL
jgi:hypothetical protein